MAFTQETKPKIKNNSPIVRIEIRVSRLLKESVGMAPEYLLMNGWATQQA